MATPVAFGSSWARDWIQVTAGTYAMATATLHPLNPPYRAGDRTQAYVATWATVVGFLTHWAIVGTPFEDFSNLITLLNLSFIFSKNINNNNNKHNWMKIIDILIRNKWEK